MRAICVLDVTYRGAELLAAGFRSGEIAGGAIKDIRSTLGTDASSSIAALCSHLTVELEVSQKPSRNSFRTEMGSEGTPI
jgi:hypothetical protein